MIREDALIFISLYYTFAAGSMVAEVDSFPSAPQLGDSHQLPLWLVGRVTKFWSVGCRWKWCGVPQARALKGVGVLSYVLVVELLSSAQEGIHPASIGYSSKGEISHCLV